VWADIRHAPLCQRLERGVVTRIDVRDVVVVGRNLAMVGMASALYNISCFNREADHAAWMRSVGVDGFQHWCGASCEREECVVEDVHQARRNPLVKEGAVAGQLDELVAQVSRLRTIWMMFRGGRRIDGAELAPDRAGVF